MATCRLISLSSPLPTEVLLVSTAVVSLYAHAVSIYSTPTHIRTYSREYNIIVKFRYCTYYVVYTVFSVLHKMCVFSTVIFVHFVMYIHIYTIIIYIYEMESLVVPHLADVGEQVGGESRGEVGAGRDVACS